MNETTENKIVPPLPLCFLYSLWFILTWLKSTLLSNLNEGIWLGTADHMKYIKPNKKMQWNYLLVLCCEVWSHCFLCNNHIWDGLWGDLKRHIIWVQFYTKSRRCPICQRWVMWKPHGHHHLLSPAQSVLALYGHSCNAKCQEEH